MPPILKQNPYTGEQFFVEPEDEAKFDAEIAALNSLTSSVSSDNLNALSEEDPDIKAFADALDQQEAQKTNEIAQRLQQRSQLEQVGLGLYGMGRGLTGGWLPQIGEYLNPEKTRQIEEQYQQFKEEVPGVGPITEIGGGIISPLFRGAGALGQAVGGAIEGASQGETLSERASNALKMAGLSGISGALGSYLGRGAGAAVEAGARKSATRGLTEAEGQVADIAARQGVDFGEAARQVDRLTTPGVSPEMTLAEQSGISLTGYASQPETQKQIKTMLTQREKGSRSRLSTGLMEAFGAKVPTRDIAAEQAIRQARRTLNEGQKISNRVAEDILQRLPFKTELTPRNISKLGEQFVKESGKISKVKEAFGADATTETFERLSLQLKEAAPVAEAFRGLQTVTKNKIGRTALNLAFSGQPGGKPSIDKLTLRDWKTVAKTLKKWSEGAEEIRPVGLRGVAKSELKRVTNGVNRQLKQIVKGLDKFDESFPALKQEAFGGMGDNARELLGKIRQTKPLSATPPGKLLLEADPETVREVLAGVEKLSGEKAVETLKASVVSHLNTIAKTKRGTRYLQDILDPASAQREILEQVLPGTAGIKKLEQIVGNEATMLEQTQRALRGSATGENLAVREARKAAQPKNLGLIQGATSIVKQPIQTAAKALDIGLIKMIDPKLEREVVSILLETGPKSVERMRRLEPVVKKLEGLPEVKKKAAEFGAATVPRLVSYLLNQTQQPENEEMLFEE